MLACDFLTVETIWLTRIYVLFFISLERRRIAFIASTSNPDGRWIAQQARNVLMQLADRGQSFRFLLHDRDSKFSGGFNEIFGSEGITIVRTPIRAPNANACAERWVGTLRRECLDRILIRTGASSSTCSASTRPITTGTGHTDHSRSNRPTNRAQRLAAHRYGTSRDTRCSAASSTNTKPPHEGRSASDGVFEPHAGPRVSSRAGASSSQSRSGLVAVGGVAAAASAGDGTPVGGGCGVDKQVPAAEHVVEVERGDADLHGR
jgi:hypothetical protein